MGGNLEKSGIFVSLEKREPFYEISTSHSSWKPLNKYSTPGKLEYL